MRESLKKSIGHSPAKGFEKYPKGSLVLCNGCTLPIYKLDRSISLGDKMGGMASAFKPVTLTDLTDLLGRQDIDAGVRASVQAMGAEGRLAHVRKMREVRAGDACICPSCGQCFVQVVAVEAHEVMDKSYTVELVVLTPPGFAQQQAPVRSQQAIGAGPGKRWIN